MILLRHARYTPCTLHTRRTARPHPPSEGRAAHAGTAIPARRRPHSAHGIGNSLIIEFQTPVNSEFHSPSALLLSATQDDRPQTTQRRTTPPPRSPPTAEVPSAREREVVCARAHMAARWRWTPASTHPITSHQCGQRVIRRAKLKSKSRLRFALLTCRTRRESGISEEMRNVTGASALAPHAPPAGCAARPPSKISPPRERAPSPPAASAPP